MKRRNMLLSVMAAAVIAVGAITPAFAADLVVFAAASMKGSLDKVAVAFEKSAGTKVTISYASSSQLAKQIEAAAPADIFISADTKWMNYLVDKGAVKKEAAINFLGNRLVLVAAKDSLLSIKIGKDFPLAETLGDDRIAMGEPRSVSGPANTVSKPLNSTACGRRSSPRWPVPTMSAPHSSWCRRARLRSASSTKRTPRLILT